MVRHAGDPEGCSGTRKTPTSSSNYLLTPEVEAANTNDIHYAKPVPKAMPLVEATIRNDPTIYPPADVTAGMFTYSINPPAVDRLYTWLWTQIKTGR